MRGPTHLWSHNVLLDTVGLGGEPVRVLAPPPPHTAPPAGQPGVAPLDGPRHHIADVGQEQHHEGQSEHGVDHAEHLTKTGPGRNIAVADHGEGRHGEEDGVGRRPLVVEGPKCSIKAVVFGHLYEEVGQLVHVAGDLLLVPVPHHPQAGAELRVVPAGRTGPRGEPVVVGPDGAALKCLAAVVQSLGPGADLSVSPDRTISLT